MNTVLVTGCSSGFGLAIARHFLDRDWHVVATMRDPAASPLAPSDHLRVLPLDVTDPASIESAVAKAGPIDVLVNNAGIGLLTALEGTTDAQGRAVFETNTLGTIAMTRAVLPQMREARAGTIVNVTSSVTLRPLHLLSVYTASKAAVNAFGDSLALELEPFGIRVRTVLPGRAPDTAFGTNARASGRTEIPAPYADIAAAVFANRQSQTNEITTSQDVADAVWRAATDPACPPRIPAGTDARAWFTAAQAA